jgi:hypothetical protein
MGEFILPLLPTINHCVHCKTNKLKKIKPADYIMTNIGYDCHLYLDKELLCQNISIFKFCFGSQKFKTLPLYMNFST